MPRPSREVKDIAEKNEKTFLECPIFELWVKRHLKVKDRVELYRKAYDLVHSAGGEDVETDS